MMLAWIMGSVSNEITIDPHRAYFADQFHLSYDAAMAQIWTTFLYCYCGWTDLAPLEKGHRLKKMSAHYKVTLDRCRTPDWARLELDSEQLALWKKRMKAIGGKPLIRQMSIPAQPPAFEDIGGRNVKQITIAPEELPARFVSMAGAAFKQLAGLK